MTTWKTNFRIITNLPKHYLNSQKQAKFLELLGEKKKEQQQQIMLLQRNPWFAQVLSSSSKSILPSPYSKQKIKRNGKCSRRATRVVNVASILDMTK